MSIATSIRLGLVLVAFLQCLPIYAQLMEEERAGNVIVAQGEVYAVNVNGSMRSLTRRAPVFVGERLVVGDGGTVQLRMIDGGLLNLSCGTELEIPRYIFEKQGNDEVVLNLLRGRMRSVVGEISGADYVLQTPLMTVNAENGDYEVSIFTITAYAAAYDGAITLTNPAGTLRLGREANFDFAVVRNDDAPRGLYNSTAIRIQTDTCEFSGLEADSSYLPGR